jgi:anti-sigma-K factor RskA
VRSSWTAEEKFRAIAASLVIAILLGAVVVMWQRNRGMETEIARLSQRVNETDQELARLREEKGIFVAPGARMAALSGTEMARESNAMLVFNRETGRAMLVANGLPPAPPGQAYQLWFIPKGKQPIPGGVFAADEKGHAEMRGVVPPEGRDALQFAVTLERAEGVPAPQGKMYLQGSAS